MDLLDRLLGHDTWTTRQLLLLAQPLTDEQLDHEFDFAHQTVRRTLLHILRNMEAWTDGMAGRAIRPNPGLAPEGRTVEGMLARLDAAALELASVTRAIRDRGGWDERWRDVPEDPSTEKSYGGSTLHVITHSMHHRAQVLDMLRRLGVENRPEGDVLSWEHQVQP